MDVDAGLIARALARCGGAGYHDTANAVHTYRNYVWCAQQYRQRDQNAAAEAMELAAARLAHVLALVADGVEVREARRRAKELFGGVDSL